MLCFNPTQVLALDQLHDLAAHVNSNSLLASNEISVQFSVPNTSDSIKKSDWIHIYLPFFSNVTAPSMVSGDYAGIPVYSVSGNYARVTGVRVMQSGFIEIEGISVTNPGDEGLFHVYVFVTEDEAGLNIKNTSNTVATLTYGRTTVSATIPPDIAGTYSIPGLIISGYTSPDAFIIFANDQAVLGTDEASSLGFFRKDFFGLQPTTHTISLYGIDSLGLTTGHVPLSIYTPSGIQTEVSNIVLSSTLQIPQSDYLQTDDIIATGSAVPGGTVTLFTDSPLRSYVTTAGSNGLWDYTISNASDYVQGDYRMYTIVQHDQGWLSLTSPSRLFSIVASQSASGTACGDISQGDLNCDSSVDLTDFSILMYYWGTNSEAADINNDVDVNLTDFSIMMYYWGS